MSIYKALSILKVDFNWAEQQHLMYLLSLIDVMATQNADKDKKRPLTNAELMQAMVD